MTTPKSKRPQSVCFLGTSCFIFLFSASALGLNCSQEKSDLRGPVKSLKQRQYDLSSPWAIVSTWEYDRMGKEIKVMSGGEREGVPISSITANNNFDDLGWKISRITKRSDGSLVDKILYAYDAQGHQNAEAWYDADSFFVRLDLREFDEHGNCQKIYSYRSREPLTVFSQRAEYQYNKLGRMVESVFWRKDGTKEINRFNAKGYLLDIRFFDATGELDHEIQMDYDVYGNEIESRTFDSKGNLTSRSIDTYEYDAEENWVKRTSKWVLKEGKPFDEITITDRKITYYDLPDINTPN